MTAGNFENLTLPRILCLHGGGSNARIFRAQCRSLRDKLGQHFRLVFADGPFLSQAGPDVMSVYNEWGPFRRWLRWTSDHPAVGADVATAAIENSLKRAMDQDDALGASGEWVALMGFSQGAKVAASLLYKQQVCESRAARSFFSRTIEKSTGQSWSFGILLAGRGPLLAMDRESVMSSSIPNTDDLSSAQGRCIDTHEQGGHILYTPTIHVHGLNDPGLEEHRKLLKRHCDPSSAVLVEWDGDHRVPLKTRDVAIVTEQVMSVAQKTGIISAE